MRTRQHVLSSPPLDLSHHFGGCSEPFSLCPLSLRASNTFLPLLVTIARLPCSSTVSSTTSLSISMERQNPKIHSFLPVSRPFVQSLSVITGDEEVSTFTSGGGAGARAAEDLLLGFPAAFLCFWVSAKPSQTGGFFSCVEGAKPGLGSGGSGMTTTESKHQVKGGLLLDVVVSKGATILELLSSKDEVALLIVVVVVLCGGWWATSQLRSLDSIEHGLYCSAHPRQPLVCQEAV
ncbi:hypothetical protein PRUPE_6G278900 [Prunus persica]|uniref:Uncharacterized protein n=1 Tax=Prunus persica TaxID=3760 RepID=A0A251NWR0_PRUPE|nr:hypothetical protein PRUPE_6G278900 [Prunus persica]